MPIIYIPGKGNIKFPDNMSNSQIEEAIKKMNLPKETPKQQEPVQQNKVATVKNQPTQKEEPSIWEKTKSFLGFGEEETKPVTTAKKQPVTKPLISQEFVEKLPETGYQAPKETISILDNEYEKKKKAVEDKYNALQNAKSNVEISSFSGGMGSQPSIRYKVNYNQQKQLELDALDVEKAKKQGKNITPVEQTYYGVKYDEAKKASQTKIETLSKQKKSYKEELRKVEGFAMGAGKIIGGITTGNVGMIGRDAYASVFGAIKAIKNTWDHNTQVDAQIAEEERQVRQTERKIELNKSGVSVFKNVDLTNDAEVIKAASLIDPTIKSDIKEARKKIGEETTKLFPTAIKQTKVKDTGFLSKLPDFSSINPTIALIEGFINYTKVGKFKNLTYEQYQRQSLEKSLRILENEQNIELNPYYDDIQSSIGVPKTKVNTKINEYINLSNGFNINELPIEDQKLFNNPSFQALANVFVNRSIPAIGEDKKKIISMANMNKYIGEKRKLFGNLNKVENIGKEEAVASAILDKNLEEQGTFSSAGFDNLLYNSTKFLTRSGDFVVNQTAAGAQIISQVVTADKYTPKWTEKILDNTDLFDNLTEEDSHFKLDFFKDDKYYIGETPSGIKYHGKLDADMDIENAFGGGFEYTINNPEVMEEIAKDFYANKEKYVASAKTLGDIEGGTSVFIENLWNSVQKEFAQEIPSLIVEGGAGGLVNAAIKKSLAKGAISSTEKAQKIARGADFLINTASAMTEMYPSIYKKYKEAAEDKDNHMPALLASGALAMGTYMTSFLQSKAIGLNGDFSTQRIMPGAIDATLETARILRKELANVADLSLREKLFNANLRKAMYQNVMKVAGQSMKDAARSGLEGGAEEVILEPLINLGVNFLNEKITGDKAYNQESLADLNFLDPNTAAVSALTGSSLSTGMDLMKAMTSKNPYSREDYLKAAFENEATFTSYVDVMTESSSNKFSKEDQAKMMTDYKALKDAYNAKKSELGVNEEALSTLNFKNPIIKSMMGNIGLREEDLEKVNSEKTFDNAIIRQSLNERDLAEKKIALDEEVEKGNLTVNAQGAYKTVGSNPLTKELETKVSEFEKLQLSSNNLSTFIDTFNKGTKNVQKEYVLEMDEATSAAPDILDVKNSSEGSYAYKALSTSVMDKQMAVSQLAEVNTKINDAKLDGQDTKDLEATKKELETTIKNSDKAINNIKKQYKAGRTETQLEVASKLRDVNTAQAVLAEKLRTLAQVEASGEEVDNSEVDQVFSEYENTVKELNKANNKLKKGYGVSLMNKEYKPMTRQSFTELKEKIKEKNVVSEKVAGGKATLGELESLLRLEYETGSKEFTGRTDITTPKTKEDIDAILSNNEQLYEVAKRLGLDNKKSLAQTKKAVKSYLTKQLSSQDETKLESISAIFSPKTVVQKNGSTLFEVNGELFLPVGNTTSMATMSEEEKNTVLTNAVITEIAKQIFNNALVYTPYNLRQLINKVIVDSGFDTEISINENTLNIIIATISELKSDLDANGFAYKLNDDVVTSNFLYLSFDRGYEGMSTPPILTVVDNEGNVHLIDFRSYSDNYVADTNTWSKELTEMQGIFADNGISVSSINVLPIRVNNSYSTANGLTTLNINKQSFNVIANNDNPISKTLLQLANDLPTLENLQEEGLLTEEEVEEFALIPMEEGVTEDKTVEKELPFTEQEYDEMVSNEFENVSDTIVEKLRNKITNGEKLSPKEFDVVSFAEGKFTEEEISKAREKYIEIDLTPIDIPTTEEEIKAEEVNKPAETIGENIIEEDTETYFAGLSRGVYIRVKPINDSFMIEIFGDNELANKYGKKKYTKEDLKNIYAENGWRAPKVFKEGKYQVLDKVTNNPILSKNYIEYVYPQGFNEVVNDVTKVGEIIGTQVEIVENNEGGYNDNPEVQKDFKNKASLAIVMNGEKIGLVPQGSPIREKLAVKKVKGVTRLQPTTARVKDVKLKDFNHQNLMPFSEWENEALASGVLVPGQYEIVYIGINNEKPVFKNKNGVVVSGTVPKDPTLGASYLMLTNIPTRNVIIPMMTPKLKEIGYTLEDMKTIFKLIDRNILTKGTEAEGEKLYLNFVDAVNAIPKESLKDPKLAALKNYLSLELGGKTLPLRASYTQSQLDKLESILAYNNANQDLNDGLLSSFVLNRLITLNDNTIGDHQIGVNPDILFSDNELVLDNLVSNKPVKKQVLPSAVAKNKNTDLVKDTYYESFLTETEDGENYVFFHKSNAPVEEISTGIDSRKFNSLRTSKEEKATQYGVASYYTLPTDGERMVGGDVYTVKVPKKQVYPMNTDPNGYRSIAESKIAENAPYREANIKKEMVRMAAEDGYKMAVGNWYYDPAGNPISGPAMRADAIVPLVPETLSYKKATDKEIDHPLKARIKAINSLMEIAKEFEEARRDVQDYSEGYHIAQDLRIYGRIPTNTQFDIMVANLPEKVQGRAEEAIKLISIINSAQEESPSGAASELMSSVVGRLKETGLANEVFEMSNAEIEEKLIELGVDAETAKQVARSIESRGGQRGTQFESAVAPESIVKFFNINTMGNTLDTKDAMETLSAISNYIDLDVSITSPTYSELQAFVEQLNNKIDSGSVDFSIIEEETGVTQKDIEKFLGTAEKRLASFEARNNIQFQTQPLADKGINLTTAGFVYNGDVYLNMDNMNLDTPIHEFGHLWLSWAKNNLGEAYARGLELAKSSEADPYRQYVMDTQPDLKVDSTEFLEEVLAQAIGDNGARLVEENSTKTKSWLQDLWDAIGKMLGLSQFTADQIMNMTLNDYANAVAIDLLSGRNITTSPEAEKTIRFSNGETAQVKPIDYDVVNGFYSPIEKRLSETKIDKQSANKWLSVIGKGDEATWTGVKAWLEEKNPQEQVTKSEIQQWMKDNRIEISEVVKGQGELNVVPMEDEPNILEVFAADDPNGDYRGNIGEIIIEKNGKFTANIPEAPQKTFNTQKEAEDYIKSKTNYAEQTKFSQYQLEGEKENYKEVLVTLPPTETQLSEIQKNALDAKSAEELAETMFRSSNIRLTEDAKDNGYTDSDGSVAQSALSLAMYNEGDDNFYGRKRLEERLEYLVGKEQLQQAIKLGEDVNNSYKKATELKNKPPKGGFKSSHFEELNILVHLRMNTRTDAEGNKVLFLEEVQSDWGQQGKKQGFKQTNLEQLKNQLVEAENEYNKLDFINLKLSEVMNTPEAKKVEELREKINAEEKAITPAPFVMDTNAWTKLGLKVALKEAVKQGADKIAWTTGEQQNDRYDLSKQVDKLYITKSDKDGSFRVEAFKNGEKSVYNAENVNKLSDIVGKDIADRAENGMETFEGDNLKVGGKGMKGFYGSPTEGSLGIVGNVAKSLFKQEPKVVQINSASKEAVSKLRVEKINEDGKQWVLKDEEGTIRGRFYTEQAAKEELSERVIRQKEYAQKNISTQYSIDITPELKEQVAEGLPMFQKKQDEGSENLLPLSQVIPIEETTTIPECV